MQCFRNTCRISIDKDTKVTNAATFTLQREDHTVGNLVRMCALSTFTTYIAAIHCCSFTLALASTLLLCKSEYL